VSIFFRVIRMDDDDAAPQHLDIGVEDSERDPPAPPKVDDPEGYYACLRVTPTSSPEEVQKAYRAACQLYHPDKLCHAPPAVWQAATAHMQKVNAAYFVLSDPNSRVAYTECGAKGPSLLQLLPQDLPRAFLLEALRGQQRFEDRLQRLRSQQPACTGTMEAEIDAHRWVERSIVNPLTRVTAAATQRRRRQAASPEPPGQTAHRVVDQGMGQAPIPTGDLQPRDSQSGGTTPVVSDEGDSHKVDNVPLRADAGSAGSTSPPPLPRGNDHRSDEHEPVAGHPPETENDPSPTRGDPAPESTGGLHETAVPNGGAADQQREETPSMAGSEPAKEEKEGVVAPAVVAPAFWREHWLPAIVHHPDAAFAFVPPWRVPEGTPRWDKSLSPAVVTEGDKPIAIELPTAVAQAWVELYRARHAPRRPPPSPMVEITGLSVHHTVTAVLTQNLQLTRTVPQLPGTVGTSVVLRAKQRPTLGLTVARTLRRCTLNGTCEFGNAALPMCAVTCVPLNALWKGINGHVEFRGPGNPATTFHLRGFTYRRVTTATALTLGPRQCLLLGTGSLSLPHSPHALLLSASYDLIRHSWSVHWTGQFRFGPSWSVGVGLFLNPTLLRLILSAQHGQHTLKVPFCLARGVPWYTSLWLTLLCHVAGGITCALAWPIRRYLERRARAEKIAAALVTVREAHSNAMALQVLMHPSAAARRADEEQSNGLVILRALYGCLECDDPESPAWWMDVTVPLQMFTEHGVLALAPGSKSRLDGFCDTDPMGLSSKSLEIAYRYGGVSHIAVFADDEAVRLPPEH